MPCDCRAFAILMPSQLSHSIQVTLFSPSMPCDCRAVAMFNAYRYPIEPFELLILPMMPCDCRAFAIFNAEPIEPFTLLYSARHAL
jgi:hypothetical protein